MADSFFLRSSLSLAGCAENIAIFGHLHRADVEVEKVIFDCEIIDRTFYKAGVITITELSEVSVKTQFLEGRSVQNYDDTFDDIYINELELGLLPTTLKENATPENCWRVQYPEEDFVALPWVYDDAGTLQNEVSYSSATKKYAWVKADGASSLGYVSWQPFLIRVARSIFEAVGYSFDYTPWQNSIFRYLLICNTLPAAWDRRKIAYILPHWSVTEFITQLERLMNAELDVDHKAKEITFAFAKTTLAGIAHVQLDKVVDEFSAELSQESEADYTGTTNLAFANAGHAMSPYYDCEWYIRKFGKNAVVYDTLAELITKAKTLATAGVRSSSTVTYYTRGYPLGSDGNKLFYAKDKGTYFIMKCYKAVLVSENAGHKWYKYYFSLCPVNQFGKLILDEENEDDCEELGMVPVCIDETSDDLGPCMFLAPASFDSVSLAVDSSSGESASSSTSGGRKFGSSSSSGSSGSDDTLDSDYFDGGGLAYGSAGYTIYKGEQESSGEYYSQIFLGFWDGTNFCKGYLPRPILDRVTVNHDFSYHLSSYTMRINERVTDSPLDIYNIADKRKYNFSFLADDLPNPRAVFHIHGHRYICEKLTATFTERGMSRLVKGVFYMLED